jgi:hypothetical protein
MPQTDIIFYREGEKILFREWLNGLPVPAQSKCLNYIRLLETIGHELRRPHADLLRDGIYELRPTSQNVNYRILYAFLGKQVGIVLHGIAKTTKVPDVEINRAIERVKRYRSNPSVYGVKYEE